MAINSSLLKSVFIVAIIYCSVSLGNDTPERPYLDQDPPGLIPTIFAPGIISVQGRFEDSVTFTPDGLECCIAVTDSGWATCNIEYCQRVDGQWTTPRRAYFQGGGDGWTCQFGPDGLGFYFISTRTGYQPDVWMSERNSIIERWSTASRVPSPVSLSSEREWAPSVTLDRTIYFTSLRGGGHGANDIWRSPYVNGRYSTTENIGPPVNTSAGEQSAFIAPDESYLIFTCGGRPDTFGSTDLYLSFRDENDTWTEPVNMGSMINTSSEERCPFVTADGKYLFFTRRSSTDANVYWVETAGFMPDPNGPIQNLTSGLNCRTIQCAINYARQGDTIVVNPGIYNKPIDLTGKTVLLQSVDPNNPTYIGSTIIQGNGDIPIITLNNNSVACEIAGLTIRAGSVGIVSDSSDATIRNCRIMDNITHGLELTRGSSPYLQNCLITGNGQTGITMIVGSSRRRCQPTIENCVIVDNDQADIIGGQPVIIDSIVSQ